MSASLAVSTDLPSLEMLIRQALFQARVALPLLEEHLVGWLHGTASRQARAIAISIRRRDFLRLSVLQDLHEIELVLDEEISSQVVRWTAYSDHDCDVSDRGQTETVWTPEARALWAIRYELSVLRSAIGSVIDGTEAEAIQRTGRRTRDGLVPSAD